MIGPGHLWSYLKPTEANSEICSIRFQPSTSDLVLETPCVVKGEKQGIISLSQRPVLG